MGRYKSIPFGKKEYDALKAAIVDLNVKGSSVDTNSLCKLANKMEAAMSPSAVYEYNWEAAVFDLKLTVGTRLVVPPYSVVWAGKINKFLAANGVTSEMMRKAGEYVKAVWKGPVFIDRVIYGVTQYSSMPILGQIPAAKPANKGWAAPVSVPTLSEDEWLKDLPGDGD